MPASDLSFIAHHSERPAGFAGLLDRLRLEKPGARIGASVRIPRGRLAYNTSLIDDLQMPSSYVLADPETRQVVLPFGNRGRGKSDHRYLQEDVPAANRARYVRQVLQSGLAHHPDALITPSLIHGLNLGTADIDATVDFAVRAVADPIASGHDLIMGVEALSATIADATARNYMINSIVDMADELPLWLRMTTGLGGGRSQVQDEVALKGLRETIEAFTANDRPVLLPYSGLSGWLMMGFGALAFGAGVPGSLERSPVPSTGGGGGNLPLHWFFVPQLLGFVLAEEMPAIAMVTGFTQCPCPHCGGSLPGTGANFDATAAAGHYLWWCITLAENVRAASARDQHVRDAIRTAIVFANAVDSAGVLLDNRSKPTHLACWERVTA